MTAESPTVTPEWLEMKRLLLFLLTLIFTSPIFNAEATSAKVKNFQVEIWADNWSALYINGKKIGEDSVPFATERSFNSDIYKFSAAYPFTIGIIARDYIENASGLEYIGKPNQQIGDGGVIFQVRDLENGNVVAYSDSSWKVLVTNSAPLNPECLPSKDPLKDCKYKSISSPKSWSSASFKESSAWKNATTYSAEEVGVKEGYFNFNWESSASLIWSKDLKLDNTILIRKTITAAMPNSKSLGFSVVNPNSKNTNELPIENTCDGIGISPALAWSGAPSNTKAFAIVMDSVPGPPRPGETIDGNHFYFILYNIPSIISKINSGETKIGILGQNFQGKKVGYTPPCSQGPGLKTYTVHLYALSSQLNLLQDVATENNLLAAMEGKVLDQAKLDLTYSRKVA